MLIKYIDKIHTFLVVYKTKSFSKASKELNISQPAVTQQIKSLETYLNRQLIERKKNGIVLTKDGTHFIEIAQELEKSINNIELKLNQLKVGSFPLLLGASQIIGNYILPEYMQQIHQLAETDIEIQIEENEKIVELLKNNKINIGFVTEKYDYEGLKFEKWITDELVLCSNKPIPSTMDVNSISKYDFICEKETSSLLKKIFENKLDCKLLNIISSFNNSIALKNMMLQSSQQLVSIISKNVISEELKRKELFSTKIKDFAPKRDIFIVYKNDKNNLKVNSIVKYLLSN